MKKQLFVLACTALLVAGLAGSSFALPNSGEYMFTLSGNDSNFGDDALAQAIEDWFAGEGMEREIDLSFYDKFENEGTGTEGENGFMTITFEDGYSGTWSTQEAIEFYSVKAGSQFAFYWVEDLAASGTWSTEDLSVGGGNTPTISHLSAWNPGDPTTPAAVPEPGTLILLGLGLVGAFGLARKKRGA